VFLPNPPQATCLKPDQPASPTQGIHHAEALADETAAKGRAAQAEAEARAAHAAGLEHQAQEQRSDAVSARGELNREYERADKVDPGAKTSSEDAETRDTPTQAAGKQVPPMTKAG
jgi:hypothetical protein